MKIVPKLTMFISAALVSVIFIPFKSLAQNINRDSLKRIAIARDSIKQDSLAGVNKVKIKGTADGRRLRLTLPKNNNF